MVDSQLITEVMLTKLGMLLTHRPLARTLGTCTFGVFGIFWYDGVSRASMTIVIIG